ncbi:hypothetical protein BaRGS_00002517 [Batillaria attramentaria]|uniref:Uncharacterized protein n=1 Tax=Batillaria attramentaria TaxID=370345 RepID=A0ABD0M3D7_9CAEN
MVSKEPSRACPLHYAHTRSRRVQIPADSRCILGPCFKNGVVATSCRSIQAETGPAGWANMGPASCSIPLQTCCWLDQGGEASHQSQSSLSCMVTVSVRQST